MRQCGRGAPLAVGPISPLGKALEEFGKRGTRLILHPDPAREVERFSDLVRAGSAASPVIVVIGPEGGFSEAEVELAGQLGFEPVALGTTIMRVETAAISAAVLSVALLGGL